MPTQVSVPLGELKEILYEVENLHHEIKKSFADEASFQNVFIEKKKLFLIYGPFIQRCYNIKKQMPDLKMVTPEENAKIKKVIEKDLPNGFIALPALLVLPFQHLLR